MQYFECKYIFLKNESSDKNVILLHGWGCSKDIFCDYFHEINEFANVIAVDLYGFGQSNVPKPFFDIYEYALQIYLLLNSLGINKLSIFCHSFGARIAIILASVFGLEIEKIVITGGAGLRPKRYLNYYFKVLVYKLKKRFLRKDGGGSKDYKACDDSLRPVFVKVVNQHLDYLLYNITSKVLLIWGTMDKETPMYMYNKLRARIENSQGFVVDKGTHFVAFSHIYLCKNKILEFLRYG